MTKSGNIRVLLPFFLLCITMHCGRNVYAANDDMNESTIISESQLMAPARIYFNSSQYQQAYDQFNQYIKLYPEGTFAEEAKFYLARCRYEQSEDETYLKEALQRFDHLVKAYPLGKHTAEAYYWAGNTYLKIAKNKTGEEKIKQLQLALGKFNAILDKVPRGNLDFNNRFSRSSCMGLIGEITENEDEKQEYLTKAVRSLQLIITNYSTNKEKYIAEAKLIEFLYKSKDYDQAISEARDFEKAYTKSELLAGVLYYHAESLYYIGQLKEAVTKYEEAFKKASLEEKPDEAILYNSKLGAGWSYFRLASSTVGDTKKKYLIPASTAFRRSLEKMPHNDIRRKQTNFKLAECLVELAEYRGALKLLDELYDDENFVVKANFLAGKAASGIKDFEASKRYFSQATYKAKENNNIKLLLDSYIELAKIELMTNSPANAYLIFDSAISTATSVRDKSSLAEARLGAARSLLDIGEMDKDNNSYIDSITNNFIVLTQASAINPDRVRPAEKLFLTSYNATKVLHRDKIECLEKAFDIINYESADAESIRYDELFYLRGRILFAIANYKSSALDLSTGSAKVSSSLGEEMQSNYTKALTSFKKSISANPRGTFAAKTMLEIGRLQFRLGNLLSDFAGKFSHQEDETLAQIYQERSHKYLSQIPDFLTSLQSLDAELNTVLSAKHLLGNTYVALHKYTNAENIFRALLNEPRMPLKLRIESASNLSEILSQQGRTEEAINILKPYIKPNLSRKIILQAGSLFKNSNLYTKAIEIFKIVYDYSEPKTKIERSLQAEILLCLNQSSLEIVKIQSGLYQSSDLLEKTISGLLKIAENFPETPSASQALVSLGQYYIDKKNYDKAIQTAQKGLGIFDIGEFRQEMFLLIAKTCMASGDDLLSSGNKSKAATFYERAMENYRQVEILKYQSKKGREYRAQATFGIATAYKNIGDENKAIGRYAYVFAHYPDLITLADNARIEAAKILVENKQHKQALSILQGVIEKNKIQSFLRKVEKLVPGFDDQEKREL